MPKPRTYPRYEGGLLLLETNILRGLKPDTLPQNREGLRELARAFEKLLEVGEIWFLADARIKLRIHRGERERWTVPDTAGNVSYYRWLCNKARKYEKNIVRLLEAGWRYTHGPTG